ncbi:hypothetical protein ASE00_16410 [Sphingomonas sp. Root710]|uniref:hypothetical protein n=1 Tax=Sphingomonas sp. Root710 TaxID=1736594 RepID=UPI0006FB98C7|nr:hypothetical protein [Sphingomonas sp. Root710]KRB80628.1 hypothetical protein ASE00_16410 [Sphingomonas sp. Root710]
MDAIINSISGREIASAIWLAVFVISVLISSSTRNSAGAVLKALSQPVLMIPLAIAALYATAEIFLLNYIGWWSVANLKTTILWLVTFAFVTMFEVATAKNRKAGLGKITAEILSVAVFVTFIAELYSFPLIVELIALPFVTIVFVMAEMAKYKPEHARVAKLMGCLSSLIGFSYVGFSVGKSVELWRDTITWANWLELAIPIILSIAFLPFLYAWRTYVAYNEMFTTISIFGIDKALVLYARWLAITRIRTDLDLLERWRKSIQAARPANKAELKHTLTALLALKEREADPPTVPPQDGWSPYLAMQFLADIGVETGHYNHRYENEWGASSPMREFGKGDGIWRNNLAYYIDGMERAATVLKIKLNVNVTADRAEAEDMFILHAMHLLEQAGSLDAVEQLKMQIAALKDFQADIAFGSVTLERENFVGGAVEDGYSRTFTVRRGLNDQIA